MACCNMPGMPNGPTIAIELIIPGRQEMLFGVCTIITGDVVIISVIAELLIFLD